MLSETLTPELLTGAFGLAVIILVTSTSLMLKQRKPPAVQRYGK